MTTSCTDDNKHTQLAEKTVFGLKKYRNMKLGFQHSTVRCFFLFFFLRRRDVIIICRSRACVCERHMPPRYEPAPESSAGASTCSPCFLIDRRAPCQ